MFPASFSFPQAWLRPAALAATLLLAACGSDERKESAQHDHDHSHEESHGRLVLAHNDGANSRVYVYDLKAEKLIADFALGEPATAIQPSPEGRYALLVQGGSGETRILDGGVWQHGDHAHADAPTLLAAKLSGTKPAHYRLHEEQAALYYDGQAGVSSTFELLSDASLGLGRALASYTLAGNHHGIAEPREGFVLASHIEGEGSGPNRMRLYELHGDHFHEEAVFATPCNRLHGGSSNEDYAAFGCEDGLLLIQQDGDSFSDSKLAMVSGEGEAAVPVRISQVAGHHAVSELAAWASGNLALYAVDPAAGSYTVVDWSQGARDAADKPVTRLQHGFDASGEHFLVLDNTGTLHVLEVEGWEYKGSLKLLDSIASGSDGPRLAFSRAQPLVFVNDHAGQALLAVDIEALELKRLSLDFSPSGLAWLGIAGETGHAH